MSDSAVNDAASQRAAEQARLRKERREAKIRAGGSARLNRITGLGGGIQRGTSSETYTDLPPFSDIPLDDVPIPPAEIPASTPVPKVHDDPEEVDISQHYYEPRQTHRVEQPAVGEDARRGMMTPAANPAGMLQPPNPQEDPFAALMTQFLPGGATAGGSPFPIPPSAGPPFGQQPQSTTASQPSSIWRILHALFALSLGIYVALASPFTGTLSNREATASETPARHLNFFYIFASAEAILLTTRFVLDGGKSAPSGMLGAVLGFLPARTAGYVRVVLRYGQVFSTVRSDLLICVFVLGLAGLLRSDGVA